MNIVLLDLNFDAVAIVDEYESFIWTDRYDKCGDFEFYSKATRENFELFKQGYYLMLDDSRHLMIIETIQTITDTEEGNKLKVTGRSLESILDRRIVWKQTTIKGNLQNGIKKLIEDAITKPEIANRKIDNFIFIESKDERVTKLEIEEAQYTGDNLYDIIIKLCEDKKLGFEIVLDSNKNFVFTLYFGIDHSNFQTDNQVVIFSYSFDNIFSADYTNDMSVYKNLGLVAGEGEGASRKTAVVGDENKKGIDRRELFIDARDLSTSSESGSIPIKNYNEQLKQRGKEKLLENKTKEEFEGEVDVMGIYQYGRDFTLGDYVHFYDQFDNGSKVRVDEMIFSWDSNGKTSYPAFKIMDKDEEDK